MPRLDCRPRFACEREGVQVRITRYLLVCLALCTGGLAPAQNAARPAPAISSRVNAQLPSWLRLSGEERVRAESGQGFRPARDTYLLNRLRLNLDVRVSGWMKVCLQAEDSRVFWQNTRPAPASQKDAMDLRLAYAQIGSDEGFAVLRAGRQSLNFGEGRVLADPNWSNVGRAFDAARLTLRRGRLKVDFFSGASVPVDPLAFDSAVSGEHVHGVYGSLEGPAQGWAIEPYAIWRLEHAYRNESGRRGNLDEKTVGVRWAGNLGAGFDGGMEMAGQTGSWAGDPIRSWMGHWVVGRTLPDLVHKPRIFAEYNRASGDRDPKDSRRGVFDQLFPASHDKFGLMDLFCNSNIVHVRAGFQSSPRRDVTTSVAYNDFRLATPLDGLYVGGKLFAPGSVNAGTHIGQEADAQALWAVSGAMSISFGFGRLFPGRFLRSSNLGEAYNIVFAAVSRRL
jgi:hypothetical protein